MSEQIESCILLHERKWAAMNLEFNLDFGQHTINANEELLKQVWINLLDNAIKFSPENQEITVQIQKKEKVVVVSASDFGSEVLKDVQERIFRKFCQVNESHVSERNGVGLAIVKRIVDLCGGPVRVNSASGVTTVSAVLPRYI